jgi:hypothetical protein
LLLVCLVVEAKKEIPASLVSQRKKAPDKTIDSFRRAWVKPVLLFDGKRLARLLH